MSGHLVFGLFYKTQAGAVTHLGRYGSDQKRASKPQGIQNAGALAKSLKALVGPCEVVHLFLRRFQQVFAQAFILGHHGLRRVERLGADLSNMVHAHIGAREFFLGLSQIGLLDA
ncbi:hypothetical protein D3C72_1745950 [compost metagenome]